MGWRARARVAFIAKEVRWGCCWCDVQVAIGIGITEKLAQKTSDDVLY
jgi:hypothetical protein